MALITLQELAKKVKMKPAIVRSRLRRELDHDKGKRWVIRGNQLPRVMKILQK